jgi:hypothetical protein
MGKALHCHFTGFFTFHAPGHKIAVCILSQVPAQHKAGSPAAPKVFSHFIDFSADML